MTESLKNMLIIVAGVVIGEIIISRLVHQPVKVVNPVVPIIPTDVGTAVAANGVAATSGGDGPIIPTNPDIGRFGPLGGGGIGGGVTPPTNPTNAGGGLGSTNPLFGPGGPYSPGGGGIRRPPPGIADLGHDFNRTGVEA